MKTTIDLPDDLLAEAKERAARDGRSVSEVVSDAVRNSFSQTAPRSAKAGKLPTFAGDGLQHGVDLDDSASLLDLMESDGPITASGSSSPSSGYQPKL